MIVDIICATYNGALFLPAFLRSLETQTHSTWRLWVRDDGSSDDTVALLRAASEEDPRIHVIADDTRLGATRSFNRLLVLLPADAEYVMCADQDDVWFADKIERTLDAMREAEARHGRAQPILVHTDLMVVDAHLRIINSSLWAYTGFDPEPATVRRIAVRNVATGATIMMNRELRELAGEPPRGAYFHDWWYACIAAAFGHVVALREPTMLYRQHGANAVGARAPLALANARAVVRSLADVSTFRAQLERTAEQARAFTVRYGDRLRPEDRDFLERFARIPRQPFFARKMSLLRLRALPEQGFLRALGVVLRG